MPNPASETADMNDLFADLIRASGRQEAILEGLAKTQAESAKAQAEYAAESREHRHKVANQLMDMDGRLKATDVRLGVMETKMGNYEPAWKSLVAIAKMGRGMRVATVAGIATVAGLAAFGDHIARIYQLIKIKFGP